MIFLYLILVTSGASSDTVRRFEFADMKSCQQSLKEMKIENKKESTVISFCASDKTHRNYNATWWSDPTKDSSK